MEMTKLSCEKFLAELASKDGRWPLRRPGR